MYIIFRAPVLLYLLYFWVFMWLFIPRLFVSPCTFIFVLYISFFRSLVCLCCFCAPVHLYSFHVSSLNPLYRCVPPEPLFVYVGSMLLHSPIWCARPCLSILVFEGRICLYFTTVVLLRPGIFSFYNSWYIFILQLVCWRAACSRYAAASSAAATTTSTTTNIPMTTSSTNSSTTTATTATITAIWRACLSWRPRRY